jgi:hypothetical protein
MQCMHAWDEEGREEDGEAVGEAEVVGARGGGGGVSFFVEFDGVGACQGVDGGIVV